MARKEVQSGMKSPTMPKEKFEKHFDNLKSVDLKYCSEFGAAEDYEKANDGLVDYVRKHRMKY